jgi:hypothetical protein
MTGIDLADILGVTHPDDLLAALAAVEERFGRNIWAARRRRQRQRGGYGREWVADAMRDLKFTSWRASTVYKVETGKRHVLLCEAVALCVLMDVRPADMIRDPNPGHQAV